MKKTINKLQDIVELKQDSSLQSFSDKNSNFIDFHNKIMVLDIQEKERQRIARDLHDYSLQNLTHLVHKLELCSMEMDDDIIQAKLEIASVRKNLKQIIEDIRNTIFDLRPMPFDDLGVKEVFTRLQDKLQTMSDMKIIFDIGHINSDNKIILMTVFRIVQECAINSVKHSSGSNLYVKIEEKDSFILLFVEDDGKGFDIDGISNKEGHFGLTIMKERVDLLSGDITFVSDESGTKINIKIPLNIEK